MLASTVPSVIAFNQQRFRHHSNKEFAQWDFAECPLPTIATLDASGAAPSASSPADLLHVKDVLGHMPLARAAAAVRNIATSGVRLIITCTFNRSTFAATGNKPVREGLHYYVDVLAPPFRFPLPSRCVYPNPQMPGMAFCLFVVDDQDRERWLARLRVRSPRRHKAESAHAHTGA
jgi:hypothetical protein